MKKRASCLVFAFLEVEQQTKVKVWYSLVDLGSIDHGSNPGSPTTFWGQNPLTRSLFFDGYIFPDPALFETCSIQSPKSIKGIFGGK